MIQKITLSILVVIGTALGTIVQHEMSHRAAPTRDQIDPSVHNELLRTLVSDVGRHDDGVEGRAPAHHSQRSTTLLPRTLPGGVFEGEALRSGRSDDQDRGEDGGRRWRGSGDGSGFDRDRDHDRDDDRGRNRSLSLEERQAIVEVVADLRPLSEEEREKLRNMPEDEFRRLISRAGRIAYLARLKSTQPALYELKIRELKLGREVFELAHAYRQAQEKGENQRAAQLWATLRNKAETQFDVRMNAKQREIELFEERVASMRERLADERARKDDLVQAWIEDLTDGRIDRDDGDDRKRW